MAAGTRRPAEEVLHGDHATLVAALEGLGLPAILLSDRARILAETRWARAVVECDPEPSVVRRGAMALARRLLRRRQQRGRSSVHGRLQDHQVVVTQGERFGLRAVVIDGFQDAPRCVLALLTHEDGVELPCLGDLVTIHGLTPREAEIALLLAEGASDKSVGDRLGISPNTVRKHAEHIFPKLGIHARKALALRLVRLPTGGGDEGHPSGSR